MVELMVAIAIAGILAATAAPSFSNLIASQRAKAVASELFASLSKARSEAIMRNANVTLQQKPGGWQNGWRVLDPASVVLDDRDAASSATITTIPANTTGVIYQPSGRVQASTAPSFVITTTAGIYQCVSIDLTGRPYMKAASTC